MKLRKNLPLRKFPNGTELHHLPGRREEADVLADQVEAYLKNGIQVSRGDTVFDVGANIGHFTALVHARCSGDVKVFSFEPIPEICSVLRANARRLGEQSIRVFECGLHEKAGSSKFIYYPNATMLSTADLEGEKEQRQQLTRAAERSLLETPGSFRWAGYLPMSLRKWAVNARVGYAYRRKERTCALRTLSDVIEEHDVTQVDLLKIDAERSELSILRGIKREHWPRIRQVVVEVEDTNDALSRVRAILTDAGLTHQIVEQEHMLEGSYFHNIYAQRL